MNRQMSKAAVPENTSRQSGTVMLSSTAREPMKTFFFKRKILMKGEKNEKH